MDVQSFEGQESPETALLLEVSWTIQSTLDGSIVKQGIYLGEHLSWSARNYASLASGLSKGLVDLGRLIAKDLEEIYVLLALRLRASPNYENVHILRDPRVCHTHRV